ncbi:MAG: acylneuraminate cytidylyltransferase family protein [Elusimicrobia bacterium]|nr:acylneuraminate cytidylyltransferase family protein [Elusimicrobiota bacterium]
MKVLGVVPARGGSKGIPRKNARLLAGRPLVAHTAGPALAARTLSRVIVSTDDAEIAGLCRDCGLEVPFTRPAELAADETPMLAVVRHAVAFVEAAGERYDAVCLLQPTNPLRRAGTIDACVETLSRSEADAVITVLPVPHEHNPHWVYFQDASGLLRLSTGEEAPIPRRQDLPPAFHREGSVYVTRRDVLMQGHSLFGKRLVGYPVEARESVNLDDLDDWRRAEELLG